MTEFVALSSLFFAAECFFGASLILLMAWLMARNGAASRRHLTWLGAFIAMLALPVAATLIRPGFIVELPAAPAPVIDDVMITAAAEAPATPSFDAADAVTALLIIWLAGVVVVAVKTIAGMVGLVRLHRRSVPHIPNGIEGEEFRGARWQLRLRTAPGEEGPITWGILRPIVLLPKSSVRWSRARLHAVLLHEFAHVRRRDSLARLIALIVCAFYWPNPFVWTAAARMRREAEIAADDAVLASGVRASAYAEQLVGLAREFGHEHGSFAGVTLSMAERSGLKDRVQSVLTPQSRSGVKMMDVLKVVALSVAVTVGLAFTRPCLAEAADPVELAEAADPVEMAESEIAALPAPPAPEAPSAPEAPPAALSPPAAAAPPSPPAAAAPPSPATAAAPPAPPSPPSAAALPALPAHLTAEEREELRREMAERREDMRQAEAERRNAEAERREALREAQAELREAKAEMRRALAEVRVEVERALREAAPEIEKARKVDHVEIRRVGNRAEIRRVVSDAMERARPEMERAIEEAHRAAAEARRHAAELREDRPGDE